MAVAGRGRSCCQHGHHRHWPAVDSARRLPRHGSFSLRRNLFFGGGGCFCPYFSELPSFIFEDIFFNPTSLPFFSFCFFFPSVFLGHSCRWVSNNIGSQQNHFFANNRFLHQKKAKAVFSFLPAKIANKAANNSTRAKKRFR